MKKYKPLFDAQKGNAKRRGIAWELTFEQWVGWWGDDIDRRGTGLDDLQMHRPKDEGPYALWNIRKGTPRENCRTKGAMLRLRESEKQRGITEERLNAAMWEPSYDAPDEGEPTSGMESSFTRFDVGMKNLY